MEDKNPNFDAFVEALKWLSQAELEYFAVVLGLLSHNVSAEQRIQGVRICKSYLDLVFTYSAEESERQSLDLDSILWALDSLSNIDLIALSCLIRYGRGMTRKSRQNLLVVKDTPNVLFKIGLRRKFLSSVETEIANLLNKAFELEQVGNLRLAYSYISYARKKALQNQLPRFDIEIRLAEISGDSKLLAQSCLRGMNYHRKGYDFQLFVQLAIKLARLYRKVGRKISAERCIKFAIDVGITFLKCKEFFENHSKTQGGAKAEILVGITMLEKEFFYLMGTSQRPTWK
jgi:hypothetical protein